VVWSEPNTICPADNATAGSLGRRRAGQLRFGFVAVSAGHIVYLTLTLGAPQFMPGIKNLNLYFFVFFFNFKQKWPKLKIKKITNFF
jgi:hypothetical protein